MTEMSKASPVEIRILEKENNKRGDLFGRLMSDLFLALGYGDVRLNIHKTGREVDVEAIHRTEKRRAIAECKVTKAEIGGDDVNKFVGALGEPGRKQLGSELLEQQSRLKWLFKKQRGKRRGSTAIL